jgi:hypothetical protein
VKVLLRPALIPYGGSLVILVEFYKRPSGNEELASTVSHNLPHGILWIYRIELDQLIRSCNQYQDDNFIRGSNVLL